MELSRDAIEQEIAKVVPGDPRSLRSVSYTIWKAIADLIVESENRIIDAEFALQELKSKPEERPLAL